MKIADSQKVVKEETVNEFPTFEVVMVTRRKSFYYVLNLMLPMTMFAFMALAAFSVPIAEAADRLSVTLTLVLAAAAFRYTVPTPPPQVDCVTFLDGYMLACYFFFSLVVAQNALVGFFSDKAAEGQEDVSHDMLSMISMNSSNSTHSVPQEGQESRAMQTKDFEVMDMWCRWGLFGLLLLTNLFFASQAYLLRRRNLSIMEKQILESSQVPRWWKWWKWCKCSCCCCRSSHPVAPFDDHGEKETKARLANLEQELKVAVEKIQELNKQQADTAEELRQARIIRARRPVVKGKVVGRNKAEPADEPTKTT